MSKLSQFIGGGGGVFGGLQTVFLNKSATIEANTINCITALDTPITVTMPQYPEAGDVVVFFDINSSWGQSRVELSLNGQKVVSKGIHPDTLRLTGAGGMVRLLYSGERWIDVTYLEVGNNAIWGPSYLGGDHAMYDYAATRGALNIVEVVKNNTRISRSIVIQDSGLYVAYLTAGTPAFRSSGESVVAGGSSSITVNDVLYAYTGSNGAISIYNASSTPEYGRFYLSHDAVNVEKWSSALSAGFVKHTNAGASLGITRDSEMFSTLPLGYDVPRDYTGGSGTRRSSATSKWHSALVQLSAGDVVDLEVGAKGDNNRDPDTYNVIGKDGYVGLYYLGVGL